MLAIIVFYLEWPFCLILILKINIKTLNLVSYDVEEMNEVQMSETNGGIIPLIIAVVAVVALSSCTTTVTVNGDVSVGGNGNNNNVAVGDSIKQQ